MYITKLQEEIALMKAREVDKQKRIRAQQLLNRAVINNRKTNYLMKEEVTR